MALSTTALQLKQLLNKLPLPDERIPEAERLIKECSEAELTLLGLAPPPRPVVPKGLLDGGKAGEGSKLGGPQQRLNVVQQVINSLQYNHTPGYYYNVSKSRPFSRIMDTAREALRVALPIKCLEAVFLGALLTAGWLDLDRLPLAFKSTVQGQTYRHIVLVVYHAPSRKWGALGLSRRPELMDKELVYDSLADLVSEYKLAYERWWHTLVRVYVGLPLEHDTYYAGPVCWRYVTLSLSGRKSWMSHRATLDKFAGQARRLAAKFRALGGKPTLEGSLGGPDPGHQAASVSATVGGLADKAAFGIRAGVGVGNMGFGAATAALHAHVTAAARYAKSASPARRRPVPAQPQVLTTTTPLQQRPGTPLLRSYVAGAPGSPTRVAASAASAAAAVGSAARTVTPRIGSGKSSGSAGTAGRGCSVPATATVPAAVVAAPAANCVLVPAAAVAAAATAAATGTASAATNESRTEAVTRSSTEAVAVCATVISTGSTGIGTNAADGAGSGTADIAADGAVSSLGCEASAGSSLAEEGPGFADGVDAICRTDGPTLASQPSRRGHGGRSFGARPPRRSSDPGGGAAALAAAVAAAAARGGRGSTREQARNLRQMVKEEERSGAGTEETVAASRCDDDDDDDEESESEDRDYLSDEGDCQDN